jgi:hypothetical protein
MHEWGAAAPLELLAMIKFACSRIGFDSVTVLAPETLATSWQQVFSRYGGKGEQHGMMLLKTLTASPEFQTSLSRTFVWGLDSI